MDWVNDNLYWTDGVYNWIGMARVGDPESFRIIVDNGLQTPYGIAVHPPSRLVTASKKT